MLRFLFSFCDTGNDAVQVEPEDKERMVAAFKVVQRLASEQNTPLRTNLNHAWVASAIPRCCVA